MGRPKKSMIIVDAKNSGQKSILAFFEQAFVGAASCSTTFLIIGSMLVSDQRFFSIKIT